MAKRKSKIFTETEKENILIGLDLYLDSINESYCDSFDDGYVSQKSEIEKLYRKIITLL